MDIIFIMKKLAFLLFFISTVAIADTYPAIPSYSAQYASYTGYGSSPNSACNALAINISSNRTGSASGTACNILPSPGVVGSWTTNGYTCPSGGIVSGSSCINAPVCIAPQQRQTTSPYACYTPQECSWPESDNGNGICQNNTCPVGQNRNPVTNVCQIPPTCGSTEKYDSLTNQCYLKTLPCPGNTHANAANDLCLPDPPTTCPSGQHDDGTYTCVADDAKGCQGNTQSGYINGTLQCVPKPNLDTAQQAAKDAIEAAQDAVEASISDPTNQPLRDSANSAVDKAILASNSDSLDQLDQIRRTLEQSKENDEKLAAEKKQADQIDQTIVDALIEQNAGASLVHEEIPVQTETINGFSGAGECPAPVNFSVFGRVYHFSWQPECDFATQLKPIILSIATLIALTLIVGTI